MTDADLFTLIRTKLFTAVIGDVMDANGLTLQFLPPDIRPLRPGMALVGRAATILEIDRTPGETLPPGTPEPFGFMLEALDDLQPGQIYITTGASSTYALWGGLMTTRAKALGAHGAVLAGFHRDTNEIAAQDFPLFSTGAYAQDQKGRGYVADRRCSITFANGAVVCQNDLVVGDIDGVLAIPARHVDDIVQAALAKVAGEDRVRTMIEAGVPTATIFARLGIM